MVGAEADGSALICNSDAAVESAVSHAYRRLLLG